ncbi:MAG: hypothetical protein RIC30_09405 [Marinoscillum sp.]|uniref:hypothetical protein n=1 Tax=Marinoscillum sp. TaxID=2024838 RepID=UPI0032FA218B
MKLKPLISFFRTLLMVAILGMAISQASAIPTGVAKMDPETAMGIVLAAGAACHFFFSDTLRQASLFAGVNKEIWLDFISENFYRVGSFLQNVVDWSAFVEYNTLNFADAGGDPDVLINNTTYPIATNQRTDTAKTIALDTYDTENTRVRNVEEMEASYDKLASVTRGHKNALMQKTHDKAIHGYGPAADSSVTPVLLTGGDATAALLADVGITGTFKKFSLKDIARMKTKFDLNDWPTEGRCMVIHPLHQMDLIEENQNLFKAFADIASGRVLNLYGFNILPYSKTPIYTESTGAKKAFGAVDAAAADTISTIAFLETEVMKAEGEQEMFYKPKSINTEQRADEIGFQKRFIALPIRGEGIAAMISDRTAA